MSTPPGGSEPKAASDARLLVDAVHEWARERFGPGDASHIATGAAECTWCPICQLIAALRGDRPELTDRLAAAAAAVVDVLGSLLDPPAGQPAAAGEDPASTEAGSDSASRPARGGSGRRAAAPRVQRIDLDPRAAGDPDS